MTPDKQPQKQTFGRELGSPMLFSVIYTVIASAIYICLGVVPVTRSVSVLSFSSLAD